VTVLHGHQGLAGSSEIVPGIFSGGDPVCLSVMLSFPGRPVRQG
jgi:hypothetical protein